MDNSATFEMIDGIPVRSDNLKVLQSEAASQGVSLAQYVGGIIGDFVKGLHRKPSPEGPQDGYMSDDPWFHDPENIAKVRHGLQQASEGKMREYSLEELKLMMGI